MLRQFQPGQILKGGEGFWEMNGPGNCIVAFLDAAGTPDAVVVFPDRSNFSLDLKRLLSARGPQKKVKAVVGEGFAAGLRTILVEAGAELERMVVRDGPFTVRFLPAEKKLLVTSGPAKTRVLIVDDSPTIRKLLEFVLSRDPEVEVVGTVGLPSEVEKAIADTKPDVITLDIHLPEMNGVELLRRYLPKFPVPTVMISSISMEEGPLVLGALEAGAVDYIQKPSAADLSVVSPQIIAKVKGARGAKLRRISRNPPPAAGIGAEMDTSRIIAVGSSTGGTEALKDVLLGLPAEIPPIVVVQHIPAIFSKAFADRLNSLCPFEVVEGKDGELVEPGKVIIAPGGQQMSIYSKNGVLAIRVVDGPPVNRHKPSVDVLFESVAREVGKRAVGLILTGMGSDGAKGLLEMHARGSPTLAQDEATCVVYGMPQAAHKIGAVDALVPLQDISAALAKLCRKTTRGKTP